MSLILHGLASWCLLLVAYWLGYRNATQRALRIVREFGKRHGGG